MSVDLETSVGPPILDHVRDGPSIAIPDVDLPRRRLRKISVVSGTQTRRATTTWNRGGTSFEQILRPARHPFIVKILTEMARANQLDTYHILNFQNMATHEEQRVAHMRSSQTNKPHGEISLNDKHLNDHLSE